MSRTAKFTKFPDVWEYHLARVDAGAATYRVALYLLRESWRSDNPRVRLANGVMKGRSVSRWAKHRALNQLGRAGLISVAYGQGKSPVVTVKFAD